MHYPVIQVFTHSRTAEPEDVLSIHHRDGGVIDLCVADGVSGFHSPRVPMRYFAEDGARRTGGQMAGAILQRTLLAAPDDISLADVLLRANAAIAQFASRAGIPLDRPDDLPAVHLAAARMGATHVDLVTTGDCFAVWVGRSGELGATPNLEWEFTRRERPEFARLEKLHGSREAAWTHIEDSFRSWRRELTNVTYATLNGQPGVENLWHTERHPRKALALLLLFTDGLADPEDTLDPIRMAHQISARYRRGGWRAVLDARRELPIGEATGIAIELEG